MNAHAKQFHACDNNKITMKNETELGKASIHVNDRNCSKKSSKKHTHKQIPKKRYRNVEKDKLRPLTHE